jgi:mismatch-specific thymine-DNA glycosylase
VHELRDKHGNVLTLSTDRGHRVTEDWMRTEVLTLADLVRPGLRAVTVGINPSTVSVAAGHYYQGLLGQRFLSRLRNAGLIGLAERGSEDDAAFRDGVGFTDIIKRATASAKELRRDEFKHGRNALVEMIEQHSPELVVFTFKDTAKAVFGPFPGNGFVPGLRVGKAKVYVMPGPMERTVTAGPTLATLAKWVRTSQQRSGKR